MPIVSDIVTRTATLLRVTPSDPEKTVVETAFTAAGGDWATFIASQGIAALPPATLARLTWANTLGDWSLAKDPVDGVLKDDTPLVGKVLEDASVDSSRTLALKYGRADLLALVKAVQPGDDAAAETRAGELWDRLYGVEPTGVLCRMVEDQQIVIGDGSRDALLAFFKAASSFKIEETTEEDYKPDWPQAGSIPADKLEAVLADLQYLDVLQELAPTDLDAFKTLAALPFDIRAKLATLSLPLTDPAHRQAVRDAFGKAKGNIDALLAAIEPIIGADITAQVRWAHDLGDWSQQPDGWMKKLRDDTTLVDRILKLGDSKTFRDLGRNYGVLRLAGLLSAADPAAGGGGPSGSGGANPGSGRTEVSEEVRARAADLRARIYRHTKVGGIAGKTLECRTPVIHRMLNDREITLDGEGDATVVAFFDGHHDFDLSAVTVEDLNAGSGAVDGVDAAVRGRLLTLKTVERMSLTPEAVGLLMASGLTAPSAILGIPKETFTSRYSSRVGAEPEEVINEIYDQAQKILEEEKQRAPKVTKRVKSFEAAIDVFAKDRADVAAWKAKVAETSGRKPRRPSRKMGWRSRTWPHSPS